ADGCPEAPLVAVREQDVAAVMAGNGTGDRQAEADTARLAVARALHAEEGGEDALGVLARDARPVVLDDDVDVLAGAVEVDTRALAVADRILDEIADGTAQGVGSAAISDPRAIDESDILAEFGEV